MILLDSKEYDNILPLLSKLNIRRDLDCYFDNNVFNDSGISMKGKVSLTCYSSADEDIIKRAYNGYTV
jgi:hypothetical protein